MLDRYHTTSIGPDEEALSAAFLKCGDLMKARGCTVMGLAVHTKNNLDGVVRSVFGEDVVRVLDRDNRLDLKGIVIQLITEKIQIRRLEGPVLAAFIDSKKMDKIVARCGVTDIVFVPWAAEEHVGYLKTYPDSREIFRSPRFDALLAESRSH
ncbi:hypothetical protein [Rhodoferax sp.]|uniref:hypothetical protein n=1 Tax=Rhodoferax sp. TaxID=50421 RepID=UPI003BB7CE28